MIIYVHDRCRRSPGGHNPQRLTGDVHLLRADETGENPDEVLWTEYVAYDYELHGAINRCRMVGRLLERLTDNVKLRPGVLCERVDV